MKMPILTIFLLFIIILTFSLKKTSKVDKNKEKEFWQREHDANFSRKKSIDDLNYVCIPDTIVTIVSSLDKTIQNYPHINTDSSVDFNITLTEQAINDFNSLLNSKIVNLGGIPNTDLKLSYGVANLPSLSEYDQNFSKLLTTIEPICNMLLFFDKRQECKTILKWIIDYGADTGFCYKTLASMYIEDKEHPQIHYLIKKAEQINTIRKDSIIRMLNSYLDNVPNNL